MFKKLFITLAIIMALVAMPLGPGAFATQPKDGAGIYLHTQTGSLKYFKSHPSEPSQWVPYDVPPCQDCDGSAEGNFDISTFAAGGGIDLDGALIPNGVSGGISAAGGISAGEVTGQFTSFRFFGRTITLGGAGGDLNSVGGGWTNTYTYIFNPDLGDKSIGVGSWSDNYAITDGSLSINAFGLAEAHGLMGGIAGQGSLDGSIIGGSPGFGWESEGGSFGLAGQGSIGGFIGGAGTVLYGSADIEAGVEMWGQSGSESYRAIDWQRDGVKTEIMGTNVWANTIVESHGNVDTSGFSFGCLEGGYVAGGVVMTGTYQTVPGGIAKATAYGSYSGAGELGCSFNGSAVGYTQTSATIRDGYVGSVMTSSAGMQVSSGTPAPTPQ